MNPVSVVSLALIFALAATAIYLRTQSNEIESVPTSTPTPPPTPLISPTPPQTQATPNNSRQPAPLDDLQYPNSNLLRQDGNLKTLESTDNPDAITSWYKEKIQAKDMNIKTFVQTNTNGNILNKLVGASDAEEVRVTISKENNNPKVVIDLSYFQKQI